MSNGNSTEDGKGEIAAIVAALLYHYWTADDEPAMRRVQIADWVEDLEEFTLVSVELACREWRRNQNRRPTIADIRKLIGIELQDRVNAEQLALPQQIESPEAIRLRCSALYATCAERHDKVDFWCFEECKTNPRPPTGVRGFGPQDAK
jgi:hypothetical protein